TGKVQTDPAAKGDALHCKFSATNLGPVAGDNSYGHLQLDAVALFLLALAQMTASGLVLIYTAEEVAFVQNLSCDYGIWERGDKTNHAYTCWLTTRRTALAVLENMLPRESCSKETDAGLLSVIGFPAFALDNEEVIGNTRNCIVGMLEGQVRLLPLPSRRLPHSGRGLLPALLRALELKQFENIECEWPLFFCYCYSRRCSLRMKLKLISMPAAGSLTVKSETGFPLLPESFCCPGDKAARTARQWGRCPTCGLSQSVYALCCLLRDGFLRPQELDPIGRASGSGEPKPDLVVQVQDFSEVHSATRIRVFSGKVLGHFYRHLGRCPTLGLSGRPISDVGILATSRLYNVGSRTSTWSAVGRPLFVIPVYHWYFNPDTAEASQTALLTTIRKLQSGYINGTRVTLGNLADFVDTSCVTQMSFLNSSQSDGLLAKARATAANESALFSRGRCRLGSTASVHSRTFGSSESSPEDQCTVRTRSRRQPPSSAAASAAAAAQLLVDATPCRRRLGEDLDVTDAGFGLDSFAIHAAAAAAAAATSSFDEDRQHSVDHSSPLAMAYQRLNSVCEGSGLRRTASWRAVIEDCEELCEGKLDNSMTHRLRKPATLEHVDSGENMKAGSASRTGSRPRPSRRNVGLPPEPPHAVINSPLASGVLAARIRAACAGDLTLGVLTQELLVYLSMLARTEPQLFASTCRGQGRTYRSGHWVRNGSSSGTQRRRSHRNTFLA
uniref:Phosphorylase b kinase regulatory subunit n=1 Tax=Macrostomum lignano TaxID=282301 RepID=A0A1I8F6R3_9PLAT